MPKGGIMKAKLKSYEFWVSVVSAIMVVLQSISIKFDLPYIQETVMGFLGILAVAGIIKKKEKNEEDTQKQENKESLSDDLSGQMTDEESMEKTLSAHGTLDQEEIDEVSTKID